ncbi:LSU ribosomal protein L25P [Methylophilus rhizosphaerae]|uniref:Large ribosomal subunit protein bL25 n=1 Tax=Methylophilus rhizosphaerae TaxID=492660 RepID=A0A1G9A530_9PROT|nr:50S ribosomal protein L25/general stress protein Ctc [Methylophilus rhizosphaerae]SDK22408.1 LSU ribosomal protein L25P [Methylophilus rhizosphaerae]
MSIEIKAVKRDVKGTGASRRLRRAGNVPGVIYGGEQPAVSIELDHKELFMQFRHEAFHASILSLVLDGKAESVLLRDYQLHPVRNTIQHIDFQRVSATEKIHVKVPFHFTNEEAAPGVKLGGGNISHIQTEADISCLAKDLPEFIEVDLGNLEVGHSIHLSEIKLPKGIEFVQLAHGDDTAVATILKPRGGEAAATEAEETPAAE